MIGGAEIFALFIPDRVELTEVHAEPDGDAVVPPFIDLRETWREDHDGYSFVTLERPRTTD